MVSRLDGRLDGTFVSMLDCTFVSMLDGTFVDMLDGMLDGLFPSCQ
jgi:hypothetical protein